MSPWESDSRLYDFVLRARGARVGISRDSGEGRDEGEEVVNPHLSRAIKTLEGGMAADVFPAHSQERPRIEEAAKKNDSGIFERR